jgi:hypothetical protein
MKANETVLEGCEIICIGLSNPKTDLVACPLPIGEQLLCKSRMQYHAGIEQGRKEERTKITGLIAANTYSRHDSLDLILPYKIWQEICRPNFEVGSDTHE